MSDSIWAIQKWLFEVAAVENCNWRNWKDLNKKGLLTLFDAISCMVKQIKVVSFKLPEDFFKMI